jgi:hypothetical protein
MRSLEEVTLGEKAGDTISFCAREAYPDCRINKIKLSLRRGRKGWVQKRGGRELLPAARVPSRVRLFVVTGQTIGAYGLSVREPAGTLQSGGVRSALVSLKASAMGAMEGSADLCDNEL